MVASDVTLFLWGVERTYDLIVVVISIVNNQKSRSILVNMEVFHWRVWVHFAQIARNLGRKPLKSAFKIVFLVQNNILNLCVCCGIPKNVFFSKKNILNVRIKPFWYTDIFSGAWFKIIVSVPRWVCLVFWDLHK